MKKWIILGIIVFVLLGTGIYLSTYTLEEIEVVGCVFSSEEDVKTAVENAAKMNNTLYLYLQLRMHDIENVPFVSGTDIDFVSKNSVRVTVYEKKLAGCIRYMDSYVYFDNDGNVLESSYELKDGVPNIEGLEVSSWEVGHKLPIKNENRFNRILNITQLIEKYQLDIDDIHFTKDDEIIFTHDDIRIEIGDGSNLSVQMMNLGSILEGLKGKKGTLYMKDFSTSTSRASFKAAQPAGENAGVPGEDTTGDTDGGMNGDTPDNMNGNAPGDINGNAPGDTNGNAPGDTNGNAPDDTTESTTEQVDETAPADGNNLPEG
ncbi:MAG: hypothetical protein K6E28_03375 [Eubacterium sp.]|nr:hypothetical protein [Eubacterium sp.]